jgi:uncharacterized protein YndB with AHSA1/START domain
MSQRNAKLEAGPAAVAGDRQVFITRIFDRPPEAVWKAWTDPTYLARWYAPRGCTVEIYALEVRPGGRVHTCIHNPDGSACTCAGTFNEVVAPERLVYTTWFCDGAGKFLTAAQAGLEAGWPDETQVTVTFAAHEGGTRVTLHQTVSESQAGRSGALPSWRQMLDRLAENLAAQP